MRDVQKEYQRREAEDPEIGNRAMRRMAEKLRRREGKQKRKSA